MQSNGGFGELIILGKDFLANTLNGISDWLTDPAIAEWFHNLTKLAKDTFDGFKTGLEDLSDIFESTINLIGLDFENGTSSWKLFFSNFFQFAQIGFLKISECASSLWDNTIGVLNAIGSGIGSTLSGGDFTNGYLSARNQTEKEAAETAKIYKATIASIENEVTASQERIAAERERLAKKFENSSIGAGTQNEQGLAFSSTKSSGTNGKNGGADGGVSKAIVAKDTWTPYYNQLLELDLKSKSDLEQLDVDYFKKLQEFQRIAAENTQISEIEKNNALLILEQEYQSQRLQIEQEAQDFINSLNPIENELLQIDDEYQQKLAKLEEFHAAKLISEESYLQSRSLLLDKYNTDTNTTKQNKQAEEIKKMQEPYERLADVTRNMGDAFNDLTDNMDKSSSSYKALFVVQKSFAFASASIDAVKAWIAALNDPTAVTWPQKLANYASAIATTTSAISQLSSVSMHDKGGHINAGSWGIVGEYGPELIQGPVSVTSRRETAQLARSAMNGANGNVIVNLYESSQKAGSVESTEEQDTKIINIFVSDIRRGGEMSNAIQNTFNLKRIGA